MKPAAVLLLLAVLAAPATAQERPFGTLREQAETRQEWLRIRLERVLQRLRVSRKALVVRPRELHEAHGRA